jgi:hypothetical protein
MGIVIGSGLLALLCGCSNLSRSEARSILLESDPDLQKTIIVQIGFLNSHCGEPLTSAKYLLLEKAGVAQIENTPTTTEVMTTAKGDDLFKRLGAQRLEDEKFKLVTGQQGCNFRSWAVPIATREIETVTVSPTGDDSADVSYAWHWNPNEIGKAFTAQSPLYKSLTEHERESLADNDFPLDNAVPHASRQRFIHDSSGWHLVK